MRRLAIWTTLIASLPLAAQPAPNKLTANVVEAWRSANGSLDGAMRHDEFGELVHAKPRRGLPGEMPAFGFPVNPSGKPSSLPDPAMPFGVYLSHHYADIKEFAGFKKLHTLRISQCVLPLDKHADFAELKQLRSLSIDMGFPDASLKYIAALPELQAFEIRNYGTTNAGVEALAACPKLHSLVLNGTKATEECFASVAKIKSLKTFNYCAGFNLRLTTAGLKRLAEIPGIESFAFWGGFDKDMDWSVLNAARDLRCLKLWNHRFGDKDLKDLAALKLRVLNLWPDEVGLSAAGWKELAACKELESLAIYGKMATDEALQATGQCAGLRSLTLYSETASDAGIAPLAKLGKLEVLNVHASKLTDGAMKHIGAMAELRHLELAHVKITDDGLRELGQLKNLRTLHIRASAITQRGLDALKRMLPELAFVYAS